MSNIVSRWFNRRSVLAAAGLAASGSVLAAAESNKNKAQHGGRKAEHEQHRLAVDTAAAKQQIAELRCLYARATDLIGTIEPRNVEEGRRIYHQIFRPDAVIGATGRDSVTGPDAWVDVVIDALKVYEKTQHLIGTQLVTIDALPGHDEGPGKASMSSYLQAWHAKADGELWLFLGTYSDELSYSADKGWQIANMMLNQVSGETRQLGVAES